MRKPKDGVNLENKQKVSSFEAPCHFEASLTPHHTAHRGLGGPAALQAQTAAAEHSFA